MIKALIISVVAIFVIIIVYILAFVKMLEEYDRESPWG